MAPSIGNATKSSFLDAVGDRDRKWWRPVIVLGLGGLLGVVAIVISMLIVLGLSAVVVSQASHGAMSVSQAVAHLNDFGRTGRSLQSYVYELAVAGISSFAAAYAFLVVAARMAQRPILSFMTAASRFRWGVVGLGLLAAVPIIGASVLIGDLGPGPHDTPPLFQPGAAVWARIAYAGAAATCLCLAALAEEMLFRGWLLQQTYAFARNLFVLLAVNGVLFSAAHFDPSLGGFLIRVAMGAAWSWIVLRTGGLEFALGAHLANNLTISLFVKPVTFVIPPHRPIDYGEIALEVAGLALLVAVVEFLVRTRRIATQTD
jgi:uncharacterized protein